MLFNIFMDWLKYRAKYKAQAMKTTAGVKAGSAMRAGINRGVEGALGGGKKAAKGAKGAAGKAKGAAGKAGGAAEKAKKKGAGAKKKGKAKGGAEEKKVGLFSKKKGGGGDDDDGGGRGPSGGFKQAERTVAVRVDIDEPLEVCGWIVALNGNHRGQDFRLVTGKNVIGTAADCDIVITDPYLSSKHATIRHDGVDGSFTIIDLDSTNGTFVNDKRASKEELIDNDTIRLGRTEMKFKALF